MAHSYHKNFYSSYCCINHSAQGKWKRDYNRKFRRIAKQTLDLSLKVANDDYYYENVKKQNYANMWCSPSDGFHRLELTTTNEFNRLNQQKFGWYTKFKTYQDYLNYFKKEYICK